MNQFSPKRKSEARLERLATTSIFATVACAITRLLLRRARLFLIAAVAGSSWIQCQNAFGLDSMALVEESKNALFANFSLVRESKLSIDEYSRRTSNHGISFRATNCPTTNRPKGLAVGRDGNFSWVATRVESGKISDCNGQYFNVAPHSPFSRRSASITNLNVRSETTSIEIIDFRHGKGYLGSQLSFVDLCGLFVEIDDFSRGIGELFVCDDKSVGLLGSLFHFVQLAVHRIELTPKDYVTDDGGNGQNAGEKYKSEREPYYGYIGVLCLLLALFAMWGSCGCFVYWHRWRWWLFATAGLFVLSVVFAYYALAFIDLATRDSHSKNIGVVAVVVPELKFGDVERKIFLADFVIAANDATLEDRPEAFNRIGMNRADHVLAFVMINSRVRIFLVEMLVTNPLIGHEQADLVRYGLMNKFCERRGAHVLNDTRDNVTLTAHGSGDDCFAGPRTTSASAPATLVFVSVLGQAADESFIDFDNTCELFKIPICQRGPNPVTHIPSSFVRAEAQETIDLKRAHSLLAGEHQVNDTEPILERLIRVLEDRAGDVGEAIGRIRRTCVALPMPRVAFQFRGGFGATTRAANALGPTLADKISAARFLIRERLVELRGGKLVNMLFGSHDPWSLSILGAGYDAIE